MLVYYYSLQDKHFIVIFSHFEITLFGFKQPFFLHIPFFTHAQCPLFQHACFSIRINLLARPQSATPLRLGVPPTLDHGMA